MTDTQTPGAEAGEVLLETAQAASILGLPTRTLVRMADKGAIPCERTGTAKKGYSRRRFRLADVEALKAKGSPEIARANPKISQRELENTVTSTEACEILGVSYHTLRRWEREGIIIARRPLVKNKVRYDRQTIEEIARRRDTA